ncbi:hypothetical protein [Cytobacillus oceanisediminis]|uniref:hypothetical protein n=1 Tax=Cytobacillus oceanisediminis TaxID=665099 RepID=UPI001FB28A30|nr:hypothetical protein [Cytobacillus oceanisediminis]UOE58019.1 hypothetical protein IRB79_27530 [Cytobacillus oceanisediminis]
MSYLKEKEEIIGTKVYAYWNLHKKIWSLSDGRHVLYYARNFSMDQVELRVREGGYQKALHEGRKNVHAFAIGTVTSIDDLVPETTRVISYNHQKGCHFYDKSTGEAINKLERCYGGEKVLLA